MFDITLSAAGGANADEKRLGTAIVHTNTFVDRIYAIHRLQR